MIAQKAAASPAAIKRWTSRMGTDELLRSGSRPGRPRILSPEQRKAIVQEAKETKKTTPKEIKRKLELDEVSPRTIRRRLNGVVLQWLWQLESAEVVHGAVE